MLLLLFLLLGGGVMERHDRFGGGDKDGWNVGRRAGCATSEAQRAGSGWGLLGQLFVIVARLGGGVWFAVGMLVVGRRRAVQEVSNGVCTVFGRRGSRDDAAKLRRVRVISRVDYNCVSLEGAVR